MKLHFFSNAAAGSALLGLAFVLIAPGPDASASPEKSYYNEWKALYPNSATGTNVEQGTFKSCQLCHEKSGGGKSWNPYGWAMRADILNGVPVRTAIQNVENLDSDNDPTGSTNLAEINADSQPGWTDGPNNTIHTPNSTTTGQLPPSGILGMLDPCGGPSSQTVRLGTPPNPNAFVPGLTTPPILGGNWDPMVMSFLPGAFIDFVAVDLGGPINVPTGLGTLLCNPPSGSLLFLKPAGTPFSIPIPNDCSYVGRTVCTQGGSVAAGPTIRLANALDLVIGTF